MQTPTIDNPYAFRTNVCNKMIAPLFCTNVPPSKRQLSMIRNLERGVFNWAVREADRRYVIAKWSNPFFVVLYTDHLRSIYTNLTPKWIASIMARETPAREFAFLTHQEIAPESWAELIRVKSMRDQSKFEDRMEASTDTFQCRKCQSRRCSYYAMQTRSADEPMTLFVSCLDCGYRFKK